MKYTGCYSRQEIEAFKPPPNSYLVCIHDPTTFYPVLDPHKWRGITYHRFWDLEHPVPAAKGGPAISPASEADIKRLHTDMAYYYGLGCHIFTSCEAGVSRSAAVREYVLRTWPEEFELLDQAQHRRSVHPNMHILTSLQRLDRKE